MTARPRAVAQLFQGHRDPVRAHCCLVCRRPALAFHDDPAHSLFAVTGICQPCHDAIDAWAAEDDSPGGAGGSGGAGSAAA